MTVAVKVPTQIVKRSGETVEFVTDKIYLALDKCFQSIGRKEQFTDLAVHVDRVLNVLSVKFADTIPSVENVQDTVVFVLQSGGEYEAAEHYIIYRHEHAKQREAEYIPQDVLDAFALDAQYFETDLQRIQFYDKYARFDAAKGRLETWPECVARTMKFLDSLVYKEIKDKPMTSDQMIYINNIMHKIHNAILNMQVIPSMRTMAMAGPAAERDNAVIYNCSYLPLESIDSFCELMSLSMGGSGVGYSCEFEYVDKLPKIQQQSDEIIIRHDVADSAEGWVEALRYGMSAWFVGRDVSFAFDNVRLAGTVLKTKGGRASGPEPLRDMLAFIRERMLAKQGKKLTTLDVHDIACAIGGAVVSGGVRRTALMSIFDDDDEALLNCKVGDFETDNEQRWYANNSAVWKNIDKLTQAEFLDRMYPMFKSGRGEPGIFIRENATRLMPKRRSEGQEHIRWGSNPCGEIILKPYQFCNLSAVVARHDDTIETLIEKVRLATIIGTIQSLATHFPNLRSIWKVNADKERLLGVDITGQLDCFALTQNEYVFLALQKVAIETNEMMADLLGINRSAAITCVKPSGNSATLLNCSSGLHARWAPYYIRNIRISATSPLIPVLRDSGFTLSSENKQDPSNPNTWVVSFPIESPSGAITRDVWNVTNQLEWWLTNKENWTEHNPSVTIYYDENEILTLLNWLWNHKDKIGGMSFLPKNNAKYDQMPYVTITAEEYVEAEKKQPKVKFERLYLYAKRGHDNAASTSACDGPICEIAQ